MADAFDPDHLAPGANLSSGPWRSSNLSAPAVWASGGGQPARTISAAAILLLGLVGNGLLLRRLRCGGCCCCCAGRFARRRKVDFFLAHLAAADLSGCALALLSQLPPAADGGEAAWPAGDAACRLFRLLQGCGLQAPSHMLLLLALERSHVAAAGPPALAACLAAREALAALAWLLALLLALPQAFVYRLAPPHDAAGRCLSVLAWRAPWHGRAYAVYGAVTSFVAPACLLGGTCGRILSASRAREEEESSSSRGSAGSSRRQRAQLPGLAAAAPPPLLLRLLPVAKRALPSPSAPRSLPRARARALQLTVALTALFALCGFPRFALELGLAFASPVGAAPTTLGSIVAATNCALNPYVCLVFHSQRPWARRLQSSLCCPCPDGQPRRRPPHRHRPPPPPQGAAERGGLWLCPCQTRPPPTASSLVHRREAETLAALAGESGL